MKLTLIGNGIMAQSLAIGLVKNHEVEIIGRDESKLKAIQKKIPEITFKTLDDKESIEGKNIIFCVKPYALQSVSARLTGQANILLSILAGTTLASLKKQIVKNENPIKKSYENAISILKNKHQINTLITGDIDEVDGHQNWIEQCSKKSGMRVFNPLWKKERALLLRDLINNNFTLLFSLVKKEYFTKNWIGKPLNETTITELQKLNIDICGENGEYHTMVTNTPFFKQKVNINTSNIQENEHFYFLNNNRLDIL